MVGVLTVAEALVSGVYRCIASNYVGRDQLDIHFYVSGDPTRDGVSPLMGIFAFFHIWEVWKLH